MLAKLRERKFIDELLERRPLVRVLEGRPLAVMEKPPHSHESSNWQAHVVRKPATPVVVVPRENLAPPPPERVRQGKVSVE